MPDSPLISIGMSVRNNAATLAVALRSVLQQSCGDWELILIDDGSTDATLEVAQSFADPRIRLVSHPAPCGLARRLNQAIGMARGRYFARMDGDDVCFPGRFELQAAYLDSHPDIDLLGTGGVVFGGDGALLGVRLTPTRHEDICRHPWSGFYLAHPSWMGRIEWFRRNRYEERARKAQDYDLLLRTYRHSRFAALSEPLIGYREDNLDLRKNFASRRETIVAQWRYARATGAWIRLPMAVMGQAIKGLIEFAVIGTRLERKVLGHRALPIDGGTAQSWNDLWLDLNKDVQSSCAD
jgi:glycosyltransferase involved in cell wall biosynthesis